MKKDQYKSDSLTLVGIVAMGTSVMIGAGIFADGPDDRDTLSPSFSLRCSDCYF